jgi:hypothetical protein
MSAPSSPARVPDFFEQAPKAPCRIAGLPFDRSVFVHHRPAPGAPGREPNLREVPANLRGIKRELFPDDGYNTPAPKEASDSPPPLKRGNYKQ